MVQVTQDILSKIYLYTRTSLIAQYVSPLNTTLSKYNINTHDRVAMFLAQIGQESTELNVVEENLNYSAEALVATFPKYFTTGSAVQYAHKPIAIANHIYANRLGNGNEASGDGWKYHGRGLIQITGKSNYNALSVAMSYTLDQVEDQLTQPLGATLSAGWFWNMRNLNAVADKKDLEACTKLINGGLTGIDNRRRLYLLALTNLPTS